MQLNCFKHCQNVRSISCQTITSVDVHLHCNLQTKTHSCILVWLWNKSHENSAIILCQSELCCDVQCLQDKSFSVTNFLPKPNIHDMFWYGYSKSFSFLLINFVRSLHAQIFQIHCVASDLALYARTTQGKCSIREPFKKTETKYQKGPSAGCTIYIRRYQALRKSTTLRLPRVWHHSVTCSGTDRPVLAARTFDFQQGHFSCCSTIINSGRNYR